MTKTKKKEKIVDFTKPEKVSEEHLDKMRDIISRINQAQMEIGISEARKHNEDIQTEHIAGSMGDPKDLIHPQKIGKVVNLGGSRFIDPTEPTE